MTQLVSSGKVGLISFLITPSDDSYDAVITTPSETIELKCSNWDTAEKTVKKTIKRIEDNQYENGRNISREED